MKKTLFFGLAILFSAAMLQADPPKQRTPAQQALYGVCVKRCTDAHSACEKDANAFKKAACANDLRVCKNDCEKNN